MLKLFKILKNNILTKFAIRSIFLEVFASSIRLKGLRYYLIRCFSPRWHLHELRTCLGLIAPVGNLKQALERPNSMLWNNLKGYWWKVSLHLSKNSIKEQLRNHLPSLAPTLRRLLSLTICRSVLQFVLPAISILWDHSVWCRAVP